MALNFPNTPALEDTYAVGSVTWRWDGTTWQSSQQGGTNNVNATTFLALTDTPNTFETGKWLKEDSGALVWTDAPEFAVTKFTNVTSFPATDVNQAKFAYAIDSGALYYSDGSSWTNNRIVVTDDTTSSDLATLIGTMQKTYTFAVDDYTTGNTQQNSVRKLVKLTDNLGNVQKWTLGVAGDGLSISKSTNPTGDDEILLTGQVQQYTPSIVASAPAADSILRLTGSGFDTGTQDLTFRGVDGLTVERVDDSTIQFRSPASTEYYDDDAKDAAFAALSGGTNTGINYTYDSTNKVINCNVTASGNNNNPVVTYDLTGTNSTTNQAIVQLVPSSGTTDTIEFVGSNGTTVAWDGANAKISIDSTAPVNADWTSTSGLSQISNKPSNTDLQANWTEVSNTTIGYIKNKPTLVESLGDLNNVDLSTAPNDQEVLKWVTANNQWEAKPDVSGAGGATTLSALSDTVIDAANLATKTKLQYDTATTKWINVEDTSNVIPSIEDITATSASIDANGYGTLDFANGYKGYVLYKVETDVEAWVRIYCDSTSRTNDNVRSEGNDPLPGSGVIAEVRTTPSNNSVLVTPGVMGFNNENPRQPNIFVAINNRSTGASAVQVTLTVLKIGE